MLIADTNFDLDFLRPDRASRRLRWLRAIAAVLAAATGLLLALHWSLRTDESRLAAQLTQPATKQALAIENPDARLVRASLMRPWWTMFGALESASSTRVLISRFEANASTGSVSVDAVSDDLKTMRTYASKVRDGGLNDVAIEKYQTVGKRAKRRIEFTLSGRWMVDSVSATRAR